MVGSMEGHDMTKAMTRLCIAMCIIGGLNLAQGAWGLYLQGQALKAAESCTVPDPINELLEREQGQRL